MLYRTVLLLAGLVPAFVHSAEFTLQGTVWERVARSASCKPDPLLLFSLALRETKTAAGKGMVAPHPLALRNAPSGPVFPSSYEAARELLHRYIREDNLTDIGIMQINYKWNGNRVKNVEQLLDPEENIRVGATILCESIARYPRDIMLAIGGYHTQNPKREQDARAYARDVLYIWRAIQQL